MRKSWNRAGWPLVTALVPLASLTVAASRAAEPQSPAAFEQSVKPLLAARCFACHGPNVQKAGLRLDTKERALQGGDNAVAIVPGKSAESELIRRITSTDPKKVMPPAGKRLTEQEVAVFRSWIDSGAAWADAPPKAAGANAASHWSFQPVRKPALPKVKNAAWVRNPIDAFVLAKLESKGIRPSPVADRVTLIRRLSLDLLGLPPTPAEVDAYVQDRRPDAYEKLVDRLLASPHYGERWGRRWLDQARYSDTNGYTVDSPRQIWMYRDWVIDALNRDLPFDEFTVEQIAGDLLVNEELRKSGGAASDVRRDGAPREMNTAALSRDLQQKLIATGFHRNTMINEEGGTDKEQFRVESIVDRVSTTGAVWLGLTLGCAQCHTHKYDPITQREYYQFFAFLNNAEEPSLPFPNPVQQQEQAELGQRQAQIQRELAQFDKNNSARVADWEARAAKADGVKWSALEPLLLRSWQGATLTKQEDNSVLVGGAVPDNDTYTITVQVPERTTAIRLEALTHDSLPNRGPGFARGNFLLTDFTVTQEPACGIFRPYPITRAIADHAQTDYPVSLAIDDKSTTGWAINVKAGEGSLNTNRAAVFVLESPVPAGTRILVNLKQEHANKRYLLGHFRLSCTDADSDELQVVPRQEVRNLLAIPAAQRTPEQQKQLAAELSGTERARLAATLDTIQVRLKTLAKNSPSTLVMRELDKPRDTFVHLRGDFLRHGPKVEPGVPAVLPPLRPGSGAPNRLDLARWLVDPRNPLTPRVTVNRVWQGYFGTGLVETENDFGTQGTPPSHPELLDYLSSVFVSGDFPTPNTQHPTPWSLKALHRLIVTSNTYKQASKARPELAEIDATNRLLARQSRIRLDGELIRDISLEASGLLSGKMGGPGVYPPRPAGTDLFTQVKRAWTPSEGEDRYRRAVYTWQWRSNPYALFSTFDAPDGTVTCTRRNRSSTPNQALMLANDQSLIEMAQGLATRVVTDVKTGDAERIRYAFRRCLSREPTSAEAGRLLAYYRSQVEGFQTNSKDAQSLVPKQLPEGVALPEAAAWTAVSRVLMNLDEFITRE